MNPIKTLLLRRNHQVFLEEAPRGAPTAPAKLGALEEMLLELGFVLGRDLRQALGALPDEVRTPTGMWLKLTLEADLGAHRPHVPLFQGFPKAVPPETWGLYARRMMSWLLLNPEQPCLRCENTTAVLALSPCGHLVCSPCWESANPRLCPICYHWLTPDEPVLRPSPPPDTAPAPTPAKATLKVLHLGRDIEAATEEVLQRLLDRASPLSPQDRADLLVLIDTLRLRALRCVPEKIPVKETMALVFGTLLRAAGSPEETLRTAAPHLRTATDVLRVLSVWMGGAPDLVKHPKPLRTLPRPLRRGVLEALERLEPHLLTEDLLRHPALWKKMGEKLHPFEFHARYPRTALAFAVLRKTQVDRKDALGQTLARSVEAHPQSLRLEKVRPPPASWTGRVKGVLRQTLTWSGSPERERPRFTSWAGQVEDGLRRGDLEAALRYTGQRPGEFFRRLDHLLRRTFQERPGLIAPFMETLEASLDKVSPVLLLTVLAHLRVRGAPWSRRVFFPRGEVALAHAVPDTRPLLPGDAIAPVVNRIEGELLRRASARSGFEAAVLDAGLQELLVPFQEQTTARALVAVPRGSTLPIPEGQKLRLFVHWMQPENQRVDIDLSVAFYGSDWKMLGKCDYTSLAFGQGAAVHSGDLTSAPAPLGASEFVDLDLDRLLAAGVRHLSTVLFSYNGIPFDQLPYAFSGFMLHTSTLEKVFDARAVEQRFDLQGNAQISVPMLVDLEARRMRWVDLNLATSGRINSVAGYQSALERLGGDLTAYFDSGGRMTLWELACLHAAARAPQVYVRQQDGQVSLYRRASNETPLAFCHRLVRREPADEQLSHIPEGLGPTLLATLRDDLPPPAEGSLGYSLRWQQLSPERVSRLAASDLVAELAVA